jgi:hypothetical protein
VDWHWKPFVQVSAFHLLAGEGGAGKGSLCALITAAMTNGQSEYLSGEPRNVIIVASEDSPSIDLVPRITAAGGNLARVIMFKRTILLPRDLSYLEEKILRKRDGAPTGALFIDPVANHIGGADTNNEGAVLEAINGLNGLADRTDCAIIGVRHLNKMGSMLGSVAWRNTPRMVLEMRDKREVPYGPDDKVLTVEKSNRGRTGLNQRREYRIERVHVGGVEDVVPRLVRSDGVPFGGGVNQP